MIHNLIKKTSLIVIALSLFVTTSCVQTFNKTNLNYNSQEPLKVGLLLPYGSKIQGDYELALSLENAARFALSDLAENKIELLVYGTESDPSIAAEAAKKAVESGVKIIIGPLRSNVANAVAVAIEPAKINVLTFSNNSAVAGGNLFLLGTSFESIADRLTKYAESNKLDRWILANPNNQEGKFANKTIAEAAQRNNVSIVGEVSFELDPESIVTAIPKFIDLIDETKANAIMLTSNSAGALQLLGELLPEQGVDPKIIKYIGLARWDVSKRTMKLPGLQGGWFALPNPYLASQFNIRYKTIHNTSPHQLASLAYDGVALIGALVEKNKNMSVKNLTQSSGFLGVNGLFRFKKDGTNERTLSVATINNNKVEVIGAAPRSFGP